jgi:signal transduction histidine kinase
MKMAEKTFLSHISGIRGKLLLYFLVLTIIPLGLVSYTAFISGRNSTEDRVMAHLTSVADMKITEIESWLTETIVDVKVHASHYLFREYLISLSGGNGFSTGLALEVSELLFHYQNSYQYESLMIVDKSNTVIASSNPASVGTINSARYVTEPLNKNEFHIEDVHLTNAGTFSMFFSYPVYETSLSSTPGSDDIIGVIVVEVNVEKSLYPIIQSWPGMGETGETLLARKEGDEIVFINALRHSDVDPLSLRVPIDSEYANPAKYATQGNSAIIRDLDYRGVSVVSAYRNIPLMNWGFVAKIDQTEAFSPVTTLLNKIILYSAGTIIIAIIFAIYVSNRFTSQIIDLDNRTEEISKGVFRILPESETDDEIGRLVQSFNVMTETLHTNMETERRLQEELIQSERLAAIGRISSIVGHELRNPLGVLRNSTHYLKRRLQDQEDPRILKHLNMIDLEITRSNNIISDLLDFARGPKPPIKTKTDTSTIIDEAIQRLLLPNKIQITKTGIENVSILIDSDHLIRILINLIQNAEQAMPEGGEIEVNTSVHSGNVAISVRDTGHGISEENQKKIFTPLFSTKAKGTGLGLYIVKQLAEANGGTISFTSQEGKGTCFTVNLPQEVSL